MMMSVDLYLAFLVATVILVAIPGPNVLLIIANSLRYGPAYALTTVAGTSTAMIWQLALIVAGMGAVSAYLAESFEVIRWIGVAYLLWLGYREWTNATTPDATADHMPQSRRKLFLGGFLVSSTNPKTLFFQAAFFPQFIDPMADVPAQLFVLSVTFFTVVTVLDCLIAMSASRFHGKVGNPRFKTLRGRITGGFFWLAGLGLAAARRQ